MGDWEWESVEGVHGADSTEFDTALQGEIGFDQAGNGFRAGASKAAGNGLIRIEGDAEGPRDLRAFREVAVIGVAEWIAAVKGIEGEASRERLRCAHSPGHGSGKVVSFHQFGRTACAGEKVIR